MTILEVGIDEFAYKSQIKDIIFPKIKKSNKKAVAKRQYLKK